MAEPNRRVKNMKRILALALLAVACTSEAAPGQGPPWKRTAAAVAKTRTAAALRSPTPTRTRTATPIPPPPSATVTAGSPWTATALPTGTVSRTPTRTPTPFPTFPPTLTPTRTPTRTPTPAPTVPIPATITPTAVPQVTPAPSGLWSRRFGASLDDRTNGVHADAAGVYVAGHFYGTTDLGNGPVSSFAHVSQGPTRDIVIAAYGPTGSYRWAKVLGSDGGEEGRAVTTDASGNAVYATGYQSSYAIDYGGGPQYNRGAYDVFVAKWSSTGAWAWSKTVGGSGFDSGNAIATDPSGNVIVAGYIGAASTGGPNFGGGALASAGGNDAFVVKYSSAGVWLWNRTFGGVSNDFGTAVKADALGNVYVAGTFAGTANFGAVTMSSAGLSDGFLVKLTSAGEFVWASRFGGAGDDAVYGLAIEGGDPVVVGKFQQSFSMGGAALVSAGSDDIFIARLSGSSSAHVWSRRIGGTGQDIATGIASGAGELAVTGYYAGAVDFGTGTPLSSLGVDVFALTLDGATGVTRWAARYGGAGVQIGAGVAVHPLSGVTVGGFFSGDVNLGSGTVTSGGANDGFSGRVR